MYGYAGNILRVDLSSGRVSHEPLTEELVHNYIGGRGFGAYYVYKEVPPGADPYGPHNILVFASGPFAGLFLPSGAKTSISAKSPATGLYGDSNVGGHLAGELKYAGIDALIVGGKAKAPSYLLIDDDRIEIRPADHLWGLGAIKTEEVLKEELGDEFQIATIGPAGENGVVFACINHDFGRQAGRCGMGAVMGSKNLKAIAVRGTRSVPVADIDGLKDVAGVMFRELMEDPSLKVWQDLGLAQVTTWANSIAALPTRNFRQNFYEAVDGLSGELMKETIVVGDKACFACPMATGKLCKASFRGKTVLVEGPEYETTALIGSNCALKSIEEVAFANYVCDELGLDTISAGNAVAFAMECFEKGIITKDDTGGIEARFGSLDAFCDLVQKIAAREGIGDLLAKGVAGAAEVWGEESRRIAIHVKGLEWSGYESRGAPSMMLAYMTCDIGAHHNRAWSVTHDIAVGRDIIKGKAAKVVEFQHVRPLFDCFGVCRLQWVELGLPLEHYAKLYPVVTGRDDSWEDLLVKSERIWNLTRAFAVREREDFGRADDWPPRRFYEESVPDGPVAGFRITAEDLDVLLDEYYEARGWDSNGRPKVDTLTRLGLEHVASELHKMGRIT
ncbi:MAG: aldehyde ferredoxin oxidoreductase family protein [Firmicutes bacterium]|nr:aldehyde ferredoxin oxidoreductase family protein [Bacillota bacterium]